MKTKKKPKKRTNKKVKKIIILAALFILLLFPVLSLTRLLLRFQIDDIHPSIECPELKKYNPDILWVIPKFEGVKISENQTWCREILSLNKTLGMHGITHEYKEFERNITKTELEEGIKIFRDCFGFSPEMFKPPHLALSRENKELLREYNLTIKLRFNQITHKVYHCNDSGLFPNWVVNVF
jgi:hypothetical protein